MHKHKSVGVILTFRKWVVDGNGLESVENDFINKFLTYVIRRIQNRVLFIMKII